MSLFRLKKKEKNKDGWFGNYKNWEELATMSGGYQAKTILDITKDSLLKIKNGEAVYERDSVLFDKKLYPYSVISALLYAAVECGGTLNVLDFGGSLGSTYYQVRDLIPPSVKLHWSVVEQEEYVTCGKDLFEDEILKFHYTIKESVTSKKANVLILSSVIQYLPNPHDFLDEIKEFGFKYIILDRTSFIKNDQSDRLTLQIVPAHIYEAQYPAWFFNEKRLMQHFDDYQIKTEFESSVPGEQEIVIDSVKAGYDKGFFLIRK
ncbi:methyltransferase, TIGR04325 family [Dyadobacter sp. 3J3]|uniref:methyltransferase, TIGR04325 family n=1 Tax=Dyadobacter sp. 3J3 TaxID=2606600 RepID=UPI00135B18AA|nr:methyltransferase, TIGR04325 family [Dyadobacter sp. 3J3]